MVDITRRSLTFGAMAAPFVITSASRAQSLRQVTFTLPWLAEGSNAYTFVAKANGYWSKRGLDVQISRGFGSNASAQAVGAGRFQFGLAAGPSIVQAAAKGLPLVTLACAGYDATMGVCVLKDSLIKSPKDLEGRKMASTVSSGDYPFLGVFAKRANFDISKVNRLQTDPNVRQRLLVGKEVDAISGFASSFAPIFAAEKVEVRNMLYSDVGLTLYNNSLITQQATLEKEPQLCADITDGLLEALKFSLLSPEESVQLFLKQVPETALSATGLQSTRIGVNLANLSMLRKQAKDNYLGYMAPDDFATMTDLVMEHIAEPGDKRPDQKTLFTNSLLGKTKVTTAEWDSALKGAEEYRKYIS
jgi:NitT/TauT family transport system substrate-binding protein